MRSLLHSGQRLGVWKRFGARPRKAKPQALQRGGVVTSRRCSRRRLRSTWRRWSSSSRTPAWSSWRSSSKEYSRSESSSVSSCRGVCPECSIFEIGRASRLAREARERWRSGQIGRHGADLRDAQCTGCSAGDAAAAAGLVVQSLLEAARPGILSLRF